MDRSSKRAACGLVVSALIVGCSSSSADYDIKLTREVIPGEKYVLHAVGSSKTAVVVEKAGQILEEDIHEVGIELDATVTTEGTDTESGTRRNSLEVNRLVFGANGELTESLPKGSVIVAQAKEDGTTQFDLKDGVLNPVVIEALSVVASFYGRGDEANHALFGTDARLSLIHI